jgi:protein phosphatase
MSKDENAVTVEFPSVAPEANRGRGANSSLVQVDIGALSHQGKVRPNNEDHFLVARFDRAMHTMLTNLPPGEIPDHYGETVYSMLVADGMGGAAAGEVASRTAISAMVDLVLGTPDWIMSLEGDLVREVLLRQERRFNQIKETMIEQAKADPRLSGMGTTMTLACSLGADLIVAHVGDSRAYLFRHGHLHQLTRDQTIAQSLADMGAISPEEAAKHPMRHVLTGAIAAQGAEARTELQRLRLSDGDQILLCTDGLTDMVPEASIAEALRAPGPSADVCRKLVDLALNGGGKDNVTVILGRYRI